MKVVTIGRGTGNDVQINDNYVSRHHLQIIQDNYGNYNLVDFGSKNGTFVNGQKVRGEVSLSKNDVVRIGNAALPWRSYFPDSELSQGTAFQGTIDDSPIDPVPSKKGKKKNSDVDWHEVNEVKIDYNEGGFGRKFGQAAGDMSGNIVGCFIGIVIVIAIMAVIGLLAF